ncbi:PhzF family phenazine biosynthesis protein [Candidatus Mcinerneyibacteriota bacterium]|nr:PhzF family phenazine biosynthesis protein [Candidatus Mcinerneyibacteriota bacterium]
MKISVVLFKAFTWKRGGGNPAGIVFSESPYPEKVMQSVAREAGLSETVFITPLEDDRFHLRFFTPRQEVPLCGHATIAAWTWLSHEKNLQPGVFSQETKNGVLAIKITEEGEIYMEQPLPNFGAAVDAKIVALSLGLSRDAFHPAYPVQVVSTGLPDILVPLASASFLNEIRPDLNKIEDVSREAGVVGYHVFAPEEGEFQARCRNFAPAVGIKEEAATGTASGALAAYLYRYGPDHKKSYSFMQGESMREPSLIRVEIKEEKKRITGVCVGGRAVFSEKCEILI